ncbi:MAG: hypothetical protein ACK5II_05335 [Paracoccus sp. (in: a-proteobacteria)]
MLHCHHVPHMATGMMTEFAITSTAVPHIAGW